MKVLFLTLLAMLLGNGVASVYYFAKPLLPQGTDDVSTQIARFRPIKKCLNQTTTLGYLADYGTTRVDKTDVGSNLMLDLSAYLNFVEAQFAVAPNFVEFNKDKQLIIGNFKGEKPTDAMLEKNSLRVKNDCGNGVFLLERK